MKEFKKFMKQLNKNSQFLITSPSRKKTIKITHIESGELYSVHPADHAIPEIKKWINKKENGE